MDFYEIALEDSEVSSYIMLIYSLLLLLVCFMYSTRKITFLPTIRD